MKKRNHFFLAGQVTGICILIGVNAWKPGEAESSDVSGMVYWFGAALAIWLYALWRDVELDALEEEERKARES